MANVPPERLETGYVPRPSFPHITLSSQQRLLQANPELYGTLKRCTDLEEARESVYGYLDRTERWTYGFECDLHLLEVNTLRECLRVLRSLIGPVNERRTMASALKVVWRLIRSQQRKRPDDVSAAFVDEMVALFRGCAGRSHIYRTGEAIERDEVPQFIGLRGRQAALKRTEALDHIADEAAGAFLRYPSGLLPEVVARRARNRARILEYFGATEAEWQDHRWHLEHVVTTPEAICDLVHLSPEDRAAVKRAAEFHIPMGVTPYYLSLMDSTEGSGIDMAIRAQVIPPPDYVNTIGSLADQQRARFDFMGEADTSPVKLVTRRYPNVCILKPYNTCSQICVYCQRNWEIDQCMAPDAKASDEAIARAIAWIGQHPEITEVLITGGDPAVLDDEQLEEVIRAVSALDQVIRIRIGTRTPVVLPFRWTDGLVEMLGRYHEPGRREVVVMTHFEHPYEITPEAQAAVQRIRKQGIAVYNQEVFTLFNSRRFESSKLRRDLRLIGVDPYYTFNTKGKKETKRYRVPIARLLQERKEEARRLPGIERTDEPVFNVPRLGKHHLRASHDRQLIMIRPSTGARVYEFHPWEKNITAIPPYLYDDVPIAEYLERLAAIGEDPDDYRSIWYYF